MQIGVTKKKIILWFKNILSSLASSPQRYTCDKEEYSTWKLKKISSYDSYFLKYHKTEAKYSCYNVAFKPSIWSLID